MHAAAAADPAQAATPSAYVRRLLNANVGGSGASAEAFVSSRLRDKVVPLQTTRTRADQSRAARQAARHRRLVPLSARARRRLDLCAPPEFFGPAAVAAAKRTREPTGDSAPRKHADAAAMRASGGDAEASLPAIPPTAASSSRANSSSSRATAPATSSSPSSSSSPSPSSSSSASSAAAAVSTAAAAAAAPPAAPAPAAHKKPARAKPAPQLRYADFEPMAALWAQYAEELLRDVWASRGEAAATRLLRADLHGARVHIVQAKQPSFVGVAGIVLQESARTLRLVTRADRVLTVPKDLCTFVFTVEAAAAAARDELRPASSASAPAAAAATPATPLASPPGKRRNSSGAAASAAAASREREPLLVTVHGANFAFRPTDRAARKFKSKPTIAL